MRRLEALQGTRLIKFRSVLGRYESSELNQMEAGDLLGVSERTFRRWCGRYEEGGEAGLLDRRLGHASGKRVPLDREAEVEALYRSRYSGFTASIFMNISCGTTGSAGLHMGQDFSAIEGFAGSGPAAGCSSAQAAAPAAARHDAASGRLAA